VTVSVAVTVATAPGLMVETFVDDVWLAKDKNPVIPTPTTTTAATTIAIVRMASEAPRLLKNPSGSFHLAVPYVRRKLMISRSKRSAVPTSSTSFRLPDGAA
jgi:hypothetical protein